MINHVEDTLKPKEDSTKDVSEILSTVEEEQKEHETERDECEEALMILICMQGLMKMATG